MSGGFAAGEQQWRARLGTLRQVVRQEVVARQLAGCLPDSPARRVLDIGCGQGTQALRLTRRGHLVTGLDSSAGLLGDFRAALAAEPARVSGRVRLVQGEAMAAAGLFAPASFDAVLCHGVLMYFPDPGPLLDAIVQVTAPGAVVSLLVRNGDALAMRPGLLGDWDGVGRALDGAGYRNRIGVDARADRLEALTAALAQRRMSVSRWYGVRVFTDTAASDEPLPDEATLDAILRFEERAGETDPYRHVAALLHLQRAYDLLEQFSPEITTVPQARQWLSLHAHFGFSHDDIDTSLDLLDQWNDDPDFVGAVLSCLATAEGLLLPDGTPVLPDMQPVTLARFRDRFSAYIACNQNGPIRPYTGDLQQLAEMSAVYQAAQRQAAEKVARDLRSGRTTVGALAACLTKPYACELLQPSLGFPPAISPDPGPFAAELDAAKAALDHPVIIETSAIVLATLLPGRWHRLRGAFTDIRMTRDAWNDLIDARSQLLRDPETIFSVSLGPSGKAGLQPQSTSAAHERLVRHFREIERALNDLSLVTAPGLGELARYTFGETDPALRPLAECAVNGSTLWSDDAALRKLAAQHRVPAFGTLALLHVLTETSRADDTLRQDVLTLARNRIGDLVLTTEELTSLAAENKLPARPRHPRRQPPAVLGNPSTSPDSPH